LAVSIHELASRVRSRRSSGRRTGREPPRGSGPASSGPRVLEKALWPPERVTLRSTSSRCWAMALVIQPRRIDR
jgi:hypothetical protein